MPDGDPDRPPAAYQVSSRWGSLLAAADGWKAALHRGVLAASAGDRAAETAWRASVEAAPNAWAHRNLGALALHDGRTEAAASHYRAAVGLRPDLLTLVLEYADLLLAVGDSAEALAALDGLSAAGSSCRRARLAAARAHLLAGDLDACGRLLDEGLESPTFARGRARCTSCGSATRRRGWLRCAGRRAASWWVVGCWRRYGGAARCRSRSTSG